MIAAWAAMTAVDILGNSAIAYLRGLEVGRFLRDSLSACYLPFIFYLPIVWATAAAYQSAGSAALVMVLGPTLLAQYVYHLYQQRSQAYDDLTEASLSFAIGMIRALDASDSYTAGHSASVGVYARDLAIELGYPAPAASVVQLAALLHDVGKIGVPERDPAQAEQAERRRVARDPPAPRDRSADHGRGARVPLDRRGDPPPSRAPRRARLPRWPRLPSTSRVRR